MSHDALFVLRRDGRESFHYDRWAALGIDRLLLAGPAEVTAYVESLERTAAPVTVPWLCGAVFVDLDRGALRYWADQFFGWEAALHRYYRALLQDRWPGFTTRWAMRPLLECAQALGREPPELAEARRRATLWPPAACVDMFTRDWHKLQAEYAERPLELAAWLAESGVEGVRDAAEWSCDVWVTLRAADGTLYDQRAEVGADATTLQVGPALVDLTRTGGPRPGMLWPGFERRLRETVFIDEAMRTVHWWQGVPAWMNPAGFCEPLWPGWTLIPDDGGPRGHAERGGRSFAEVRSPPEESLGWLRGVLDSVLGKPPDPQAALAREARRLRDEHPHARVTVLSAGSGAHVPAASVPRSEAELAALIAAVDGV